jgi:hypothetical protein
VDRIPDDSETGQPEDNYNFRGHFLDLRTFSFALTDKGHTLESASEKFGGPRKYQVKKHGIVAKEYIDYNRQDVMITSELAFKLLEEFEKHPIVLQSTKAYSPASIGKAYLRTMGIPPILQRQPDFPKTYLGHATTAYYGGRAGVWIRKVVVPVVYTDFLSMYPTVNILMDLWAFVIARKIKVIEHCQAEITKFLNESRPEDLFKPATWKALRGFVKVIPDGDILPCRGKYGSESNDWQVGVNHLYSGATCTRQGDGAQTALWYSLPDVVASVVLNGRVPKIVDAFRIEPVGVLDGLTSIKLRGEIEVDPGQEDLFKVVVEQRKRVAGRKDADQVEKDRLDGALKVLASSTSYGIYAQMDREDSDDPVKVTCYGIDEQPFTCTVAHPDAPGEYCFPPLAALITGAARLMLALLEYRVAKAGGTYAMEDTDSMAIVATEHGGMVPCPGGPHRMDDGRNAVFALPWNEVHKIEKEFAALKPYDPRAVTTSILKIEKDNFDPETGAQRQLYCYAISAKRYVLFLQNEDGTPVLLQKGVNSEKDHWKQHGLGHLLNPIDPAAEDRDWIRQIWLRIVRGALGLPVEKLDFENIPAVGRTTVSSPAVMKPLAGLNVGKKYAASENPGGRKKARVKTYGEVLREYEYHPEAKYADADGKPCQKQTVGLLQRRHVVVDLIKPIGRESNHLEDVEAGLIHSEENVYTEYPDERRDEWTLKVLPAVKQAPLSLLIGKSGLSRRALLDIRAGRSRPHRKNRELLAEVVRKLGLI